MTLASKPTKSSPERSSVTPTKRGENTHAEPLPPTLLRLPSLHSTVAMEEASSSDQTLPREPTHRVAADAPVDKPIDAQPTPVGTTQSVAMKQETKTRDAQVVPPAPQRPGLMERAGIRDLNVAAFVDRLATRKTLSIALVVVAVLAIWMPRSSDSPNTTAPGPLAGSNGDETSEPFSLSKNRVGDPDAMTANAIRPSEGKSASADDSVDNPQRRSRFKPEFSVATSPITSPPIEPVSHETTNSPRESAAYVMDPLASEANEQIRRMDATYADLPSVAAMDAAAFDPDPSSIASDDDTPPLPSDDEEGSAMPNLVKSRTPNPISNWAEYLPPANAQNFAGQTVSSSASPSESSTAGQTVADTNDNGSVRTTDSPVAPNFGFALPGSEELIDADAHVAMPPLDGTDQVQVR